MASPPESTVHNDQTNLGGPSCRQFCTIITSKGKTHMRGRAGSGLVLAGANTWLAGGTLPVAAEDGVITSLDVIGLDLAGTALVVLSACETGLGVMEAGEGVLGLRRAFLLAGASTVVVSLWKVADQATTTLMDEFYRRLLIGKSRAGALRHAKLHLRAQGFEDPVFWAAFVCLGDPRLDPQRGDRAGTSTDCNFLTACMAWSPRGTFEVVDGYVADLRASVEVARAHPELAQQGEAAVYGLIAHAPFRDMVRSQVLDTFASYYAPHHRETKGNPGPGLGQGSGNPAGPHTGPKAKTPDDLRLGSGCKRRNTWTCRQNCEAGFVKLSHLQKD